MEENLRSLLCLKCCPRCNGALFRECDIYGCDVECPQCGYVMSMAKLEELIGRGKAEAMLKLGKLGEKVKPED